jgi:hypothetical protein
MSSGRASATRDSITKVGTAWLRIADTYRGAVGASRVWLHHQSSSPATQLLDWPLTRMHPKQSGWRLFWASTSISAHLSTRQTWTIGHSCSIPIYLIRHFSRMSLRAAQLNGTTHGLGQCNYDVQGCHCGNSSSGSCNTSLRHLRLNDEPLH